MSNLIRGISENGGVVFCGVDSTEIVRTAEQLHHTSALDQAGWKVGNVDATILAQKPKLAPHIPQMRDNLAQHMGVEPGQVNVKATTEEKLGFTGAEQGIAAHAVCLLEQK